MHAKKRDRESKPANEINRTTRAPFASGVSEPAQHAWIGAWITHRVLAVERQWLWLVVNLRRSQLVGFMRETKMEKTAGKSVRWVREERYGRKPRGISGLFNYCNLLLKHKQRLGVSRFRLPRSHRGRERTRICGAVYRVREFVNASGNAAARIVGLVSHPDYIPLISLWLVFARDETNGTPDE